ncbi:MAG: prolyl oligopeptidase family serine peptidase, partial [Longimicrobiales bacterium]
MQRKRTALIAATCLVALIPPAANAQAPAAGARKPLEHDVYDIWNRITSQSLSEDGAWVLYGVTSEKNDPVLHVKSLNSTATYQVERGEGGEFSDDERFVVFRLKPSKEAVKQARKEKKKPDEMPQDSLGVLDLTTGRIVRIALLKTFKTPEKSGGWLAYHLGKEPVKADSAKAPEPNPGSAGARAPQSSQGKEKKKEEGTTLVLRNLVSGEERRIPSVTLYELSDDGARLVYTTSTKDGAGDGAFALETSSGAVQPLMTGKGDYKNLALDEPGRQVAFLANVADYEAEQSAYTLYHSDLTAKSAVKAVATTANAPEGWWVSENGTPSFSANGQRLFFGTAPRPDPEQTDSTVLEDEKVVLDVWAWTDPYLQPMQLRQLDQERRRTYQAVVNLKDGKVVQLATEDVPTINLALRGDADIALGRSGLPYRQAVSWGEDGSDFYIVDVRTGAREQIMKYVRGNVSVSPNAKYASWFDGEKQRWFVMDLKTREVRDISQAIPQPVHNELHDSPSLPGSYGSAGWTTNDAEFLIYDKHDIWAVDPTGNAAPRNVTEGAGRRDNVRFRYVSLDPEERSIDPAREIVLSAFNLWTKQDGFYRDHVRGGAEPQRLVMVDKSLGTPRKAKDADVMLLTRSSFQEFPDLYVSDPSFANLRRITDANPQQSQYSWGTSALVQWRSANGQVLQGVLYKPENFDASKQYPMMVYFYERLSDNLNNYVAPAAGGSSINISFYVSRGYLVFTPDIPYRVGYPGESAMHAVVPGVLELLDQGFVDPQRVGVQGHSWGGYQIAYMVTKTNLFRAAEAGAPVANMISAYGGIRWSSGMSRMFQYEKTQSRIGGSLWDEPLHFIENSPIFWADKVQTPLLMMHNDQDGAVPWEQGIEYFVALRRLSKPVWLLNYNGEDHGLRKETNRKDWTTRMQQ